MRLFGTLLALLFAVPTLAAPPPQVLHGHLPLAATRLTPIERLAGARRLDLSIALPLRNREALTNLLQQLYDRASPGYHHFLTPAEFAQRFSPTEQHYQELVAFAKKQGFTVVATHPNRTLLDVNAQVPDIERAFHLTLRVYRHPSEARNFFAPDVEPSLDLATPVLAIGGLDDFVLPRPMGLRTSLAEPRLLAKSWTTGTGPRGAFIGRDFRAAYAPGVELDGSGQAVGLFELDGYYPSDVIAYETLAGLPQVPLSDVLVNGPIPNPGQGNIEVALDIDMAISMAPGLSRIFVYQGHTPNDILNRMATDNAAKQLSCSWGFGAQVDAARDQIFLQYAAQGQSFFQASGDYGAWTGPAMAPSDNPYITIVGGTSLTTSGPGGTWLAETAWAFGGGGISTAYPIPAWQQGLNLAASQGSSAMRNFPDVACVADDSIWLVANNGQEAVVGGTSASTPLWAGFTALANQQAASAGLPSVGFVNPALYALGKGVGYGATFHDIVTGNNTNSGSANRFWAVPGFDLCTGWGTPAGSNLLQALVAPLSALQISPAARFLFAGPASGPLNPPGMHYTLTNAGAASLNWFLVNTSLWVNVSPTNGTLAPGAAAVPVSVALNSLASNLVAGAYSATLRFLSANEQLSQNREVTLAIVTPPVLTTQPASLTVPQGATASFSVASAPNALLFYQWRYGSGASTTNLADGENISGSASATLTLSNVSAPDVGAYSVVVSNVAGAVTSSNALLALMASPPMITAQPASQNGLPGQTLRLTVGAAGTLPLFYSWRANNTNLSDGGRLSGSASTTLMISNVSAVDAGTYSLLVSNSLGSAISSNATVAVATVTAPGVDLVRLWSFNGGTGGANPNGLMQAADGKFYGTAQRGGAYDAGTIFQLTSAGVLTPLYAFIGSSDGATPFAPLTQDVDGSFYGTAFQGGAYDEGTVFRMSAGGLVVSLATFNITNGDLPFAGLTRGADGAFYGTTCQGGASHLGEVFRISTNGALTTLYSFTGQDDGGLAHAGLMQGADGLFYGATFQGGAYHGGTVFKMTTNGTETTMVSLDSTNGAFLLGGLAQDSTGLFYGAASGGGRFGNGTLFRMTPAGLLTNLHSFTGGDDGARPAAALLLGSDGNFYGTTAYGGIYGQGTLFRMLPDGTLTNLACFDGYNGANPQAALIEGSDGNIYGTTQNGGDSGQGVAFQLRTFGAPQITEQPASQTVFVGSNVLFSAAAFGGAPMSWQWQKNGTNLMDGAGCWGSTGRTLVLSNVSLGGTGTYSVTVSNALGSVTSASVLLAVLSSPPLIVQQPASLTLAPGATARFGVAATGNLPLSFQWQRNGTNLADSASISGSASSMLALAPITEADNGTYAVMVSNSLATLSSSNAVLTVVPVSAAGTRMTTLRWFDGINDASNPNALVAGTNGSLYGTTQFGGQQHAGTVFVISTNGAVNPLASFSPFAGAEPRAGLIQGADGNFYGTASLGGANNAGSVFQMTPDGVFSNLYSFRGDADGAEPLAPVVQGSDGNFYGTTSAGNVFRLSPGGVFTNLYSSAAGDIPSAGLVQGSDGNFYGVGGSGAFGYGAVFRMSSDGVLTNLHSFTGDTDGRLPAGLLVQAADGNFYGAATHSSLRGFPLYGTIFKMTPGGTLTPLYILNFTDGPYPHAGLTAGADGNFYGTSYGSEFGPISQGPSASNGTVFKITPGGSLTTLVAFDGLSDGAHPASAPVFGMDGGLYGTTTAGGPGAGGTVFRLSFAPQITRPPVNLTVPVGARVDFTVGVFGTAPFFYRWLENGTNLVDGTNLSGAATATLTLSNLTPANAGQYSVIVTNALGSVTNATARLNVVFPPMFQSPSQTNGTVTLNWSAIAGQRYQLQYRPALSAASWNNLGASVVAAGTNLTASDSMGSATQRFYRVILLPQ